MDSTINRDSIVMRLRELGYDPEEKINIDETIRNVEEYICTYCNIETVPPSLFKTAEDIIVGRIIKSAVSTSDFKPEALSGENDSIKEITEGDISITYKDNIMSTESYIEYINELCNKTHILNYYKRLRW